MGKLIKVIKEENKWLHRKVCLHCVHYQEKGFLQKQECRNPRNRSLVDEHTLMACEYLRHDESCCGKDGKWFEEKSNL